MDFDPGARKSTTTFGINVEPGETLTVDLQWAEPWFGVTTDLDAYLLDAGGNLVAASRSEDNVDSTQRPVEILCLGTTKRAAHARPCSWSINRVAASARARALKFALLENGGGVTPPSTRDRPAKTWSARRSSATAAPPRRSRSGRSASTRARRPRPTPRAARSPTTSARSSGAAPAAALSPGRKISKPDLVATDCGKTPSSPIVLGGVLALLRHLGRGASRRRGGGADAQANPAADTRLRPRGA